MRGMCNVKLRIAERLMNELERASRDVINGL